MDIIKDFLLQLALIASLIFTFQIFIVKRQERTRRETIAFALLMGIAIVLCMSFPAYANATSRIDIRVVPLLLGLLYGGMRTGLALAALIVLYRLFLGYDLGFVTTVATLFLSMALMIILRTKFANARKKTTKLRIALILSTAYCLIGVVVVICVRGFALRVLEVNGLHLLITTIALTFFILLYETINEMLARNEQLQTAAKDAEIAFLRSQIKPHFLYNALNSIAELCIREPKKAEELTLDLSQYLRGSFDFKQLDSLTTIERELELVQAYLNIEKARFGERLRVEYDVDVDPWLHIPPLILQPLVENAIRHGLMPSLQGGTVRIRLKKGPGDRIYFAVEDDGCGLSESRRDGLLNPDANSKGVGLWNINQRIKLLYDQQLLIESAEGTGTKVSFDIPA